MGARGYDQGPLSRLTTAFVTAWIFRTSAWLFIGWLIGWRTLGLLATAALATHGVALVLHALRASEAPRRALLALSLVVLVGGVGTALYPALAGSGPVPAPGLMLLACLAVSYLVDVYRGRAVPSPDLAALLYLLQVPVMPAGPLSRMSEFSHQVARADITMAGFSYGVRRIVQGLTKVYLVAGPLGSAAATIFALRVTTVSTDTAWLGAVCAPLASYFYLTGFTDIGIGLGKMLGFRYQENFRRPFTADSLREFWRCWNVTLITWLRDYLGLPIAGHVRPTFARFGLMVAGFVVVGLWFEVSWKVLPWAVYMATWLALEALVLGRVMERAPTWVRHLYVLLVTLIGWTLLRASGPGPLLGYLEAMTGAAVVPFGASRAYLTLGLSTALVSGLVFAGPMVGNLSRWRVTVDAATASLLMMLAATGVLLWQAVRPVAQVLLPRQPRR